MGHNHLAADVELEFLVIGTDTIHAETEVWKIVNNGEMLKPSCDLWCFGRVIMLDLVHTLLLFATTK